LTRPNVVTRPWRAAAALAAAVLASGLAAGCSHAGSGPAAAASAAPAPASAPAPLSLTTALTAQGTSWAAVPMGAASGPNLFWQLFTRPAGSTQWSLATPPDVPTNGALILASTGSGSGGRSLTAGVRPALSLRFSPVTVTTDAGRTWASGPPAAGLADVPDALGSAPGGQLIALATNGQASLASPTGTSWTGLTSERALAKEPAASRCGLTALTAAAYTPAGAPLLAGNCTRPGVAGIFSYTKGAWDDAAPPMPASLGREQIRVLRLTRTDDSDTALLEAGTGPAAALLAAWTSSGGQWTVSPPLPLGGARVLSTSFGGTGAAAVVLSGNRGAVLSGPGARWQALPALPSGTTVTLALPAAGGTDALAAAGSMLTVWHLAAGSAQWAKTQVTKVPVQYGSSG
jgi:hypothetical protein